ncbi:MAG: hypothetical protein COW12_07955 [Candidatus Omnitrophica bacterium CG12_big_fil_rev_8_21_14_0_65_45_16]|nr:MAG: hypothetical protein COW12_07955 [Candidatus Omnitrophica bacterium CG12_big_fil_rev_8_21_14_0_65_45_16]
MLFNFSGWCRCFFGFFDRRLFWRIFFFFCLFFFFLFLFFCFLFFLFLGHESASVISCRAKQLPFAVLF